MTAVAVVLGGGGLIGHAWHLGVLAGLAEATGWDARAAELMVGTSAGAVAAAEVRAGLHPGDLVRPGVGASPTGIPPPVLGARSWRPAAPGMALRAALARAPAGVLAAGLAPRGRRDTAIISDAITRLYPPGCPWPVEALWVCAVRLEDGRRVVFSGADAAGPPVDVATAVAASCAMSGYFAPVRIGGRAYVDGGARSATNADVVAGSGFDLVVVSSPMSLDVATAGRPRRGHRGGHTRRQVHGARLRREVTEIRRLGATVVTFEPGPDDVAAMGRLAMAMDLGRRAAVAEQARASVVRRMASPAMAAVRSLLEVAAAVTTSDLVVEARREARHPTTTAEVGGNPPLR